MSHPFRLQEDESQSATQSMELPMPPAPGSGPGQAGITLPPHPGHHALATGQHLPHAHPVHGHAHKAGSGKALGPKAGPGSMLERKASMGAKASNKVNSSHGGSTKAGSAGKQGSAGKPRLEHELRLGVKPGSVSHAHKPGQVSGHKHRLSSSSGSDGGDKNSDNSDDGRKMHVDKNGSDGGSNSDQEKGSASSAKGQ